MQLQEEIECNAQQPIDLPPWPRRGLIPELCSPRVACWQCLCAHSCMSCAHSCMPSPDYASGYASYLPWVYIRHAVTTLPSALNHATRQRPKLNPKACPPLRPCIRPPVRPPVRLDLLTNPSIQNSLMLPFCNPFSNTPIHPPAQHSVLLARPALRSLAFADSSLAHKYCTKLTPGGGWLHMAQLADVCDRLGQYR